MRRRTEIKRETHQLTIIRPLLAGPQLYCEICLSEVTHFRIAQAAAALSVSEIAVFRLAENDQVHSTETPSGSLMVCGNSIASAAKAFKPGSVS